MGCWSLNWTRCGLGRGWRAGPLLDWADAAARGELEEERAGESSGGRSYGIGWELQAFTSLGFRGTEGLEFGREKKKGGFRAMGVRIVGAEGEWESELRFPRPSKIERERE
ncbi:hypothetical protein CRG98_048065, partial [Punica granatum]